MKKFTFGNPEKLVPSKYCDGFNYIETEVKYPETNFKFKKTKSGCILEFPIEDDCRIFGFGYHSCHTPFHRSGIADDTRLFG